ncbi:hypothetical protein ACQ5SO_18310 [Rhodovulum sp. DZ06]|uniref:hypothetical protein n=1 Tax=Rhodovulum sp. DZ06 TaxID=3425126 RepID=UPI003D358FBD
MRRLPTFLAEALRGLLLALLTFHAAAAALPAPAAAGEGGLRVVSCFGAVIPDAEGGAQAGLDVHVACFLCCAPRIDAAGAVPLPSVLPVPLARTGPAPAPAPRLRVAALPPARGPPALS